MTVKLTAADPFVIVFAIYLSLTQSWLWALLPPIVALSWFYCVHWDSKNGWRFKHAPGDE